MSNDLKIIEKFMNEIEPNIINKHDLYMYDKYIKKSSLKQKENQIKEPSKKEKKSTIDYIFEDVLRFSYFDSGIMIERQDSNEIIFLKKETSFSVYFEFGNSYLILKFNNEEHILYRPYSNINFDDRRQISKTLTLKLISQENSKLISISNS